jgi:septal ring factor EnvC (AmiA/AmiB activator)
MLFASEDMQKKIIAEGERDEELFEKFMCYCKNGGADLTASITAAENKQPQLEASITEAKAQKEQLEKDLTQHKADREEAKGAIATATALRNKEAAAYAKDKSDMDTNIAAMGKAVTALEKGASGFLQTSAASVIRKLTVDMDMSSTDRDVLTSFLSSNSGYAPQSGAITGILKQMKETMEKELADATTAENEAIANFEALVAAKEKEIASNSEAIESKTSRLGEVGVNIVAMEEDLDDTTKALMEDKKFLANLESDCKTKEAEYDVVKKTRGEELVALSDTIKILNDDDALDLFKKTLPSASLLQTKVSSKAVKRQALLALSASKSHDPRLDLISLALKGKKVNFDKVLKMIDDMVVLLGEEQKDDDAKKAYCEKEIDKTEDEVKALDLSISDLEKAIEDAKESIATLTEEIAALVKGVKALDKSVAEATEQRKEENEEYKSVMAGNTAAKDLLGLAKNRMNKFYNPKMYKAPPKRELSAEDRIVENMGGEVAFVQIRAHSASDVAPPPPPEAVGAYQKKGQESAGVLTLIDMLVADLDKEMQEMTVEEKDAQKEYEEMMADSAEKRTIDTKSIAEKESTKADTEANLEKMNVEKKDKVAEAYATATTLKDLHLECDWLLSNFDARKEARAGEVDSLKKAKAVLSGADFSF